MFYQDTDAHGEESSKPVDPEKPQTTRSDDPPELATTPAPGVTPLSTQKPPEDRSQAGGGVVVDVPTSRAPTPPTTASGDWPVQQYTVSVSVWFFLPSKIFAR